VNSLPKTVTRQRRDCDLNPGPSAPESSTLITRLPSHPPLLRRNWLRRVLGEDVAQGAESAIYHRPVSEDSVQNGRLSVSPSLGMLTVKSLSVDFHKISEIRCRQNTKRWS